MINANLSFWIPGKQNNVVTLCFTPMISCPWFRASFKVKARTTSAKGHDGSHISWRIYCLQLNVS